MEIQVFRPKQFGDMTRDYKLFADDVEIATLKRGDVQTITISKDTMTLQARIDWCTSRKFEISTLTQNKLTVKNSFSSNFITAIFLPLYYITVGKNKYLKIEQGIQ